MLAAVGFVLFELLVTIAILSIFGLTMMLLETPSVGHNDHAFDLRFRHGRHVTILKVKPALKHYSHEAHVEIQHDVAYFLQDALHLEKETIA
jgi:hypothetical protein